VSDFFPYRSGELHVETLPVSRIATAVGTPFYLYSAAGFTSLYRRFAEAFIPEHPLICYAVSCVVRSLPASRPSGSSSPGLAKRRPSWRRHFQPASIKSMSSRYRNSIG